MIMSIKVSRPAFQCFYLGKIKYRKALRLQETLVKYQTSNLKTSTPILLLLQHFPVYTIGIRSASYTKSEQNYLLSLGADFVQTNRGGLITFHGPGQLVAYPIFNLRSFSLGVRKYVHTLEETIIHLCAKYNIEAVRSPHTGVWAGNNKICALGINTQQGVTSHGLALNCNTDMSWFSRIVPCGIHGKGVTSISECLGRNVGVGEVIPKFIREFESSFNCESSLHYLKEELSSDELFHLIKNNRLGEQDVITDIEEESFKI